MDPDSVIHPIARNCYPVELCNEEEKHHVLSGGVWTYQGDLVASRMVNSHKDLTPQHIGFASVWVQMYNIPEI